MTSFANVAGPAGHPAIGNIYAPDTTSRFGQGELLTAYDSWWGGGEFMYVKANGSIRQFGLVVITNTFNSTTSQWEALVTEVPNTANLGRSLGVAMAAMTSGQYGWIQIGGVVPVNCTASVAADTTFGIVAAGQGGALAISKQIVNARVVGAATTTVAKTNCVASSGSTQLTVTNADGWFVGAYLSGTGIAAATTVTAISPDNKTVTLSAATTAQITGTVTATYNNATIFYNVAHINRPFAQGVIT